MTTKQRNQVSEHLPDVLDQGTQTLSTELLEAKDWHENLPLSGPQRIKDRKIKFLRASIDTASVKEALEKAGMVTRTGKHKGWPYYNWIRMWSHAESPQYDPVFVEMRNIIADYKNDQVKSEMFRRAIDGWEEPVFSSQGQVGTKRVYSDNLLKALWDSHPESAAAKQRAMKQDAANVTINNNPTAIAVTANGNPKSAAVLDGLNPKQLLLLKKMIEAGKEDSHPPAIEGEAKRVDDDFYDDFNSRPDPPTSDDVSRFARGDD